MEENINVLTGQDRVERTSRTLHSSRTTISKPRKSREADKTQQVDENRNVVTNRRIVKKSLRTPHSPGAPSHIAGQRKEVYKNPQVEDDLNMVVTPLRTPTLPRTLDHVVEEDIVGQTTPEASPTGTVFNDFRLYQPWVDVPTPEKQPLESANQMSPTLRDNNDLLEGEASAPWRPPSPGNRRFRAPQSPYQALSKSEDRDNDCYTPTKTKGNSSTRKTLPNWMKSPFTATPDGSDLAPQDSAFSSISKPTTTSGKNEESAQSSANPSSEKDRYEPTEESTQDPSNYSNENMLSEPTEDSAQSSTSSDSKISLFEPAEKTPPSANPSKRHKPASFPKCRRSEEPLNENSNKSSDTNSFITPKRPKGRPNASSRRSEAPLDSPSSSSNTGSLPKTTAVSPASSKIPIRTRPKICGLSSSSNATTKSNLESQNLRARFARLRRQTVPEAREGLRSKDGSGS